MRDLDFESYAKQLTEASGILPDDAIAGYLSQGKMQPIMLYAYRIAAYCAQEVRTSGKAPTVADDTDYIDAVQECILHVPQMVAAWSKKSTHKFASYCNAAFKTIVLDYLWEQAKGGTDYGRGKGPTVDQFPDVEEDGYEDEYQDEASSAAHDVSYAFPPQGYRDPLEELIAAEDEDRALKALMKPDVTPEATRLRNSRVWRTLRLKGAKHHD